MVPTQDSAGAATLLVAQADGLRNPRIGLDVGTQNEQAVSCQTPIAGFLPDNPVFRAFRKWAWERQLIPVEGDFCGRRLRPGYRRSRSPRPPRRPGAISSTMCRN